MVDQNQFPVRRFKKTCFCKKSNGSPKMNVFFKTALMTSLSMLLASCLGNSYESASSDLTSEISLDCSPIGVEVNCESIKSYSVVMDDQFSRSTVVTDESEDFLGWRKIIDDMGRIVADEPGNHVNSEVVDDSQMGPAADGSKYLMFYGRQGGSVHNLYLVSNTLSLNAIMDDANVVTVKFKYLPVHLESGEYLTVDVCNSTVDDCGVGSNIDLAGLNGVHWKTVFSTSASDEGLDFNGRNHQKKDYITAHVPIYAKDFQRDQFVVRFKVRVDQGFVGNDTANEMVDGVLLDSVQITAISSPVVVDDDNVEIIIKDDDGDGIITDEQF